MELTLKQITEIVSSSLQQIQEQCLGTCSIYGVHSFIIEHDPETGYTVVFQVREMEGTSLEHFTYVPWDPGKDPMENLLAQAGKPYVTNWKLKKTE